MNLRMWRSKERRERAIDICSDEMRFKTWKTWKKNVINGSYNVLAHFLNYFLWCLNCQEILSQQFCIWAIFTNFISSQTIRETFLAYEN